MFYFFLLLKPFKLVYRKMPLLSRSAMSLYEVAISLYEVAALVVSTRLAGAQLEQEPLPC